MTEHLYCITKKIGGFYVMYSKIRMILLGMILTSILMMVVGCNANTETNKETDINTQSDITDDAKPDFIIDETDTHITLIDGIDNEVTISKNLQRVIVLQNSILDLWYMVGGTAIARVSGDTNVPKEAEEIEIVGSLGSPNLETIIALQPDLIIMPSNMSAHIEMQDVFKQNNIEHFYVDYSLYTDFIDYLDLFSRLNGTEGMFKTEIAQIQSNIQQSIARVSEQEKAKVLIIFATSRSARSQLLGGLVGDMINMLGAINIAEQTEIIGSDYVEFSMERVVERDPDFILITTMGDEQQAKERVAQDIESNHAWAALRAVKEGNVHYLDKDLYLFKPNARYDEAIEKLAQLLYPEAFKN